MARPRLRPPGRCGGRFLAALLAICAVAAPAAQGSTSYRFSFADREQKAMRIDVTFVGVPAGPLQLLMSRSSPGRYATHDFAKNVSDVRATDASGNLLPVERPSPNQWTVSGHSGEVRLSYRLSGEQVDGTYVGVDGTHAHINMPAAIIWARGFEMRPIMVRFEPPPGSSWRVATQLLPGRDSFSFTAPNLQYLMDSPTEVSAFTLRTFTVGDNGRTRVFRVAVHHNGTDAELDAFVRDVEGIVREARYVFGEYPAFEGNTYTFIVDARQGNSNDAMEHRNSTFITAPQPLRTDRANFLVSAAHEFCHTWNTERIRPASLEPFNFEDANPSGELWLAEGFCNYYGSLMLRRAGFWTVRDFARDMGEAISAVITQPGRQTRSVVEMSRLATLVDGAEPIDPAVTDGFISYYTWGQALGIGLDLMLRTRTDGKVTLDDFMRALWKKYGRSAASVPGYVQMPYTEADLRHTLAEVVSDPAFADDFFARYVDGREVIDYAPLVARAGLVLSAETTSGSFRLVPAEDAGQPLTDGQRRFRDSWLSSGARNIF